MIKYDYHIQFKAPLYLLKTQKRPINKIQSRYTNKIYNKKGY